MTILDHISTGSVLHRIGEDNSEIDIQSLVTQIKSDLHPGQLAFVEDNTTEIIGLSAGYGAGKTRSLAAKAVILAALNQALWVA